MLPPPRLLLADNDPRVRSLWVDILHHFHPDWTILEAADTLHAQTLFQDHGADIIITAHHLPVMNGLALITRLRGAGQQVPIVLVANDPPARRDITVDARTVFVARPARMHPLLATITHLIARARPDADHPADHAVADEPPAFREVGGMDTRHLRETR